MEIARNHYSGFIKKSGVFRKMKDTKPVPVLKPNEIRAFRKKEKINGNFFLQ